MIKRLDRPPRLPSVLQGASRKICPKIDESSPIWKSLEAAGANLSGSDLFGPDPERRICSLCVEYVTSRHYAQPAPEFRRDLTTWRASLEGFISRLPAEHSAVVAAVIEKWRELNPEEPTPYSTARFDDVDFYSDFVEALRSLLQAVDAVAEEEKIGSRPGRSLNRPERQFVMGLARVFKEHTGREPRRVIEHTDEADDQVGGPFGRFVKAVESELVRKIDEVGGGVGEKYRLGSLDHLIRSVLSVDEGDGGK